MPSPFASAPLIDEACADAEEVLPANGSELGLLGRAAVDDIVIDKVTNFLGSRRRVREFGG